MKTTSTGIKNNNAICALFTGILILCFLTILAPVTYSAGTLTPIKSNLKPATIVSHDVKVTINNSFAQTEVVQRFSNPNTEKFEAIYEFPLPKESSLSEVTVQVGEQVINGEVIPKAKAKNIYEKEKKDGNNAGLAEKNGYQNYRFNVANIKPNDEITVKFVYYQSLKLNTGTGRYLYPLENGNTDEVAEQFWTTNSKVQNNIFFEVILKSAWPLMNIRTPGYNPINVTEKLQEGNYSATYNLSNELTKDFVFYYRLQENLPGRVEVIPYRSSKNGEGTFMMVITPGLDLKPLTNGSDYVFVLDASGSMSGGKIRTLSKGIGKVISKLNPKDRFRIITFESKAQELTNDWTLANESNVRKWIERVSKIQAGGGTNLYTGLKMAISNLDADRASSLILVTDAVTNTGIVNPKEFYNLMKKYDLRIFSFLLGNSGNWPLMQTISEATGGYYTGISNSDDIIGQILLAKDKVTHECLHNAKLQISGVKTFDLTGKNPGKIYYGQQLIIFGHYEKGGSAKIKLDATLTGSDKTYETTFNFPEIATDNPEIERLWAIQRVEHIQNMKDSGLVKNSEAKEQIKDIGVKYQVVTDETTMLILSDDKFKEHSIERMNKKRVAIEHQAQLQRSQKPVTNYRVDSNNRMFNNNTPSIGGGAIDPFTGVLIILFGLTAGFSAFRKYLKRK